jgi:hypothetical protein
MADSCSFTRYSAPPSSFSPPISATKFFSVVASVASPLAMRAAAIWKISRWTGSKKWSGFTSARPVEHVVGGQDRAEKLLLGLDVVGQDALVSSDAAPSDDAPPAGTGNCSFMGLPRLSPPLSFSSRVLAKGVRGV